MHAPTLRVRQSTCSAPTQDNRAGTETEKAFELDAHRHQHVAEEFTVGHGQKRGALSIGQREAHFGVLEVAQNVE